MATRFTYDGADLIGEYDSSGALLRRSVHGPGEDEPLVWYEGSGASDRRWLTGDNEGSIVAATDGAGGGARDEYGVPRTSSTQISRFLYTGQTRIPELSLYNYKARFYSATLGRCLTD